MNTSLPLMEQFYTIQGEGMYAGSPAYFIRLAGCDVGCVWCDVKDSWDASIWPKVEIETLVNKVVNSGAEMAVITGGEPAMYNLQGLTNALHAANKRVHIETSAAYEIIGDFDWITLSPKKFKFPLESELSKADELKAIVFNKSDLEWAERFVGKVKPGCQLLLQPEWDKREQVMPMIIDYVKSHPQWRISLQTHKYIGVP